MNSSFQRSGAAWKDTRASSGKGLITVASGQITDSGSAACNCRSQAEYARGADPLIGRRSSEVMTC